LVVIFVGFLISGPMIAQLTQWLDPPAQARTLTAQRFCAPNSFFL